MQLDNTKYVEIDGITWNREVLESLRKERKEYLQKVEFGIIQYVNGFVHDMLRKDYHDSVIQSLEACDLSSIIVATWKIKAKQCS